MRNEVPELLFCSRSNLRGVEVQAEGELAQQELGFSAAFFLCDFQRPREYRNFLRRNRQYMLELEYISRTIL